MEHKRVYTETSEIIKEKRVRVEAFESEHSYTPSLISVKVAEQYTETKHVWHLSENTGAALIREAIKMYDERLEVLKAEAGK